jgi:hypothetical protein
MPASWFEELVGFKERAYEETQANLEVVGTTLRSRVNDRSYGIGVLETPSLAELRDRAAGRVESLNRALRVSIVVGDVGQLHRDPTNQHALFQVAAQFNLFEMTGPDVTPEDGVTRYAFEFSIIQADRLTFLSRNLPESVRNMKNNDLIHDPRPLLRVGPGRCRPNSQLGDPLYEHRRVNTIFRHCIHDRLGVVPMRLKATILLGARRRLRSPPCALGPSGGQLAADEPGRPC